MTPTQAPGSGRPCKSTGRRRLCAAGSEVRSRLCVRVGARPSCSPSGRGVSPPLEAVPPHAAPAARGHSGHLRGGSSKFSCMIPKSKGAVIRS